MHESDPNRPSFWRWFIHGDGGKSGIRRIFDGWMVVHFAAGVALTAIIPTSLQQAALAFLLPMAAVFVGTSFAWGGNAQAVLQSEAIDEMARRRAGGLPQLVWTFQLTILVVMVAIFFWSLAAVGVYEQAWFNVDTSNWYFLNKILLYTLASLAIRACWHVVLGANLLILAANRIRQAQEKERLSVPIQRSEERRT